MSQAQQFTILIDPSLVSKARLDLLLSKLSDFAPVLQEIGIYLEGNLLDWFDSRGMGSWAQLAISTQREKARHWAGAPDLVRTGALRTALTEHDALGHKFIVTGNSISVGVYGDAVAYAQFLNDGNPAHNLPARMIAHMTPGAQQEIVNIIAAWLGGMDGVTILADAPLTF